MFPMAWESMFTFFYGLLKCYKTAAWEFKAKWNYGYFIPEKALPDQDFNKHSLKLLLKFIETTNQCSLPGNSLSAA